MNKYLTMSHPAIDLLPECGAGIDDVRTQVWAVLSMLYPRNGLVERRCEPRYPFPHLIHMTPLDRNDAELRSETLVVVGRHLSQHGLGFYHPDPLPYRRMIASIESGDGRWVAFLVDLNWCRFTKHGWYESGGRLLETATSPMEAAG